MRYQGNQQQGQQAVENGPPRQKGGIMKAESRNFRFHPSAFILVFSRASPLNILSSLWG
jgi:hypothetical protein